MDAVARHGYRRLRGLSEGGEMRRFVVAAVVALMVVLGAAPPAAAAVRATGRFTVVLDLTTVALRDVGPAACLLHVDGELRFTGTVVGTASGTTQALIDAPCASVATSPPGTAGDVFGFRGSFAGTVAGEDASGTLTYTGVTRPGGSIRAVITLRGGATAWLHVRAVAGQGGTYAGVADAA
jgi:hypothetical protein